MEVCSLFSFLGCFHLSIWLHDSSRSFLGLTARFFLFPRVAHCPDGLLSVIHSATERHRGCVRGTLVSTIMNKAALNTCMQVGGGHMFLHQFHKHLGTQLQDNVQLYLKNKTKQKQNTAEWLSKVSGDPALCEVASPLPKLSVALGV